MLALSVVRLLSATLCACTNINSGELDIESLSPQEEQDLQRELQKCEAYTEKQKAFLERNVSI
jgi:hypothetical protein